MNPDWETDIKDTVNQYVKQTLDAGFKDQLKKVNREKQLEVKISTLERFINSDPDIQQAYGIWLAEEVLKS